MTEWYNFSMLHPAGNAAAAVQALAAASATAVLSMQPTNAAVVARELYAYDEDALLRGDPDATETLNLLALRPQDQKAATRQPVASKPPRRRRAERPRPADGTPTCRCVSAPTTCART